MSTELQVAHTPMVWIGFCLFAWLYVIGFAGPPAIPTDALWHARLFIGYGLATLLTYVTLFIDRKEPAAFRRMLVARAQGRWRRLWEEIPAWTPTLAMAGITAVVLAAQLLTIPAAVATYFDRDAEFIAGFSGVAWLIGTLLFTVRDVAIVLFFNLGPRRLRADLTAGLYLAILYALIPGILGALGLQHAAAAFLPWMPLNPTVSLLSGLIQATLAVALVIRRWRHGFGTPKAMTAD
jgi:hypothetical protein